MVFLGKSIAIDYAIPNANIRKSTIIGTKHVIFNEKRDHEFGREKGE